MEALSADESGKKSLRAATSGMKVEWLKCSTLNVDEVYQRHIQPPRVKRIRETFDTERLDPLRVSRRPDGTYWVIDGRHRLEAIRTLGWGDQHVPCFVQPCANREAEALLFHAYNTSRAGLKSGDAYRSLLEGGDPDLQTLAYACRRSGYRLYFSTGHAPVDAISAVGTLLDTLRHGGPAHLADVLGIMRSAWNGVDGATRREIISGAHYLTLLHGNSIDRKSLARKLSEHTPLSIIARARANSGSAIQHSGFRTYLVMVDIYNSKRRPENCLEARTNPKALSREIIQRSEELESDGGPLGATPV